MPTLNINNDVVLFPSALVGIGTSNPYSGMSTKLYVGYPQDSTVNNADQFISIGAGGGSTNKAGINFLIYSAGYGGRIYTDDSTATVRGLAFDVLESGTFYNAMNITRTTTPNVLIGTTTDLGYKLFVNGSIVNQGNINSTGDPGLLIDTGQRLGFNESGVRSWTVKATGGNLAFNSGDGYGSFTFGASVTASSLIKSGGTSSQYLMADGSVSTIQTANVYTQTFFIPNTGATAQWVKVGTWTAAQGGEVVTVEIAGHAGYNATTGQNQSVYIYMKTSNGSSVDPSGFAADSSFYTQGLNVAIGAGNVIWEANAAGVSATTYTLYVLFGQYTNGSQYTVTSRGGTWANVGTLTAPSGTTSSSTILLSEFRYSANNQLLTLDGNSSVLIGTTTNAGFKLDVDGTGRFTNLLQVNGPSGEARTDLHGISLYNANNDYRISLDTQSGTRGFIRYNVDTAGSTFHGHIFSAGDYNSSVTDLMLVRADGNVGIGTTDPGAKLEVIDEIRVTSGGAYASVTTRNTGATGGGGFLAYQNGVSNAFFGVAGWYLGNTDTGIIIGTDSSARPIRFYTNSEQMRITGGGNILIGTSSDNGNKLRVQGTTWISGNVFTNGEQGIELGWTGSTINDQRIGRIRPISTPAQNPYAGGLAFDYYKYDGASYNWFEGMRLNGSGNVGIGTTSPASKLDISIPSSYTTAGLFSNSAINLLDPTNVGAYSQITFGYTPSRTYAAAYLGYISTNDSSGGLGSLVFGTRNVTTDTQPSERMRITSAGNVLINTTTDAGYKLDVFGKTRIYTGAASGATTPDADTALLIDSAGNQYIELRTSSASSGLMQGILFTDNGQNAFIGFKEYTGGTAGTYGEALHLAYYDYSSSDPNNGIYFGTSNTPSDGVSNVQMFIKGNGNVGIGTTNPSTPLEIAHSNGNAFIVRTNDSTAANNAGFILANVASATPSSRRSVFIMDANGANGSGVDYTYFDVYGNGVTSIVNAKSDGILAFGTADSERMRITAAGNVGINTTAPQQLLHVLGATNGYAMIQGASDSGQAGIYFKKEDTTGTMDRTKGLIVFHTNVGSGWGRGNLGFCLNSADSNAVVSVSDEKFRMVDNGDFLADGDVVAYSTTISDARYKTNIQPIESALYKVNQMRGVSFDWTAVRSGREFGVIAQEIEQIAPEVVSEKELLNGDTMKTVSYTSLVPFLIESIKELTAKVAELESKLNQK
jgi:hypothetical protein